MTMVEAQKGRLDLANMQDIKGVKDGFKISNSEPQQREYKMCKQLLGLNMWLRNKETILKSLT